MTAAPFIFNGVPIDPEATLRDLDRTEFEDSFYLFCKEAWKYVDSAPFTEGWAMQAICEHLQAVCDGDIRRLIINIPPRCAKSTLTSVMFPAWLWAQPYDSPTSGPGARILAASYAKQLVIRDSVNCRKLIESQWYQGFWGDRFQLSSDQNTKHRFSNDKNGERLTTSVEATLTGEGGNCFVAGTMVSTPQGETPIEELRPGDIVKGFDHLRNMVVFCKVVATRERASRDLYQIRTVSGLGAVCTGDHPIFSPGRGYVPAAELGPDDRLIVQGRAKDSTSPHLRLLREKHDQAALRGAQGPSAGQSGRLLLQNVLQQTPRGEKFDGQMPDMRRRRGQSARQILLAGVLCGQARRACKNMALPALRGALWPQDICVWGPGSNEILLAGVRGRGSLRKNEGRRKLKFRRLSALFERISPDARDRFGARRVDVRRLPDARNLCGMERSDANQFARPPHQRGSDAKRPGKPYYAVPALSREASRWDFDRIASVTPLGDREDRVYDIQVEGCGNFFADGLLVHNCIIIDDANAANEVNSETKIQAVKDWWDGTMSTRHNDPKTGAFIVIQQRLAQDDLTGHIQDTSDEKWDQLILPMRFEADRKATTSIGWTDPRRREGTLLWPERFGEAEVARLEKALGPWQAAGQLQQRPAPKGGGIIKRDWWRLWDKPHPDAVKFPLFDFILAALDTAYTEKETNDPSAMTVWGVFTDDETAQISRVIDADGRPMYQDRIYSQTAPKLMLMHAWTERLELHELVEKVNTVCKKLKVDLLLIENKAAGHSVAQELERLHSRQGYGVQLDDPKSQDKVSRLYSVQHLFAEGLIYAPDKSWADLVITQTENFPKAKHDDLTDTVSAAIRKIREMGLLVRSEEHQQDIDAQFVYPNDNSIPLYPV